MANLIAYVAAQAECVQYGHSERFVSLQFNKGTSVDTQFKTAHDMMFEDLIRFVEGDLSFKSKEMERQFLKELAWVWTEFRDTEGEEGLRVKFATEYWSERALKKIYEISSGCTESIDLNSIVVENCLSAGILSASSKVEKELRHEHVVPKKLFIDTVLKLKEQGTVDESFKNKLLQCFV